MSTVLFREEDHKYISEDPNENIEWTSVTTFLKNFKEPFNAREVAEKISRKRTSKYYKMPVDDILQQWKETGKKATDLGTWYHNGREYDLTSCTNIQVGEKLVPVVKPIFERDLKKAPDQKLTEGIYPEHFVYLKSMGICGQSDVVEVIGDTVKILDFKTNKELTTEGFTNYMGKTKKMLHCVSHLDDCKMSEYNLQLSIYMYIILKHNPSLQPGDLQIDHIIFEKDEDGELIKDHLDNPIVKDIVSYKLPYLRKEVIEMFKWFNKNK